MATNETLARIEAMKIELEKMGCQVTITVYGDEPDAEVTVYITYPPDVPAVTDDYQ